MSKSLHPSSQDLPVAVSIATSDSGCGAGIQADLLTFAARGVFGNTVFCCLTAQNPDGVTGIEQLPLDFIQDQWNQTQAYFQVGAIKTGMLFSSPIIKLVAQILRDSPAPAVVDPVMVATSGAVLLQPEAIVALKQDLLPVAALVTPNLDEVQVLLGTMPTNLEEMMKAARTLTDTYQTAFLIKGGHLKKEQIQDVFLWPGGQPMILETDCKKEVDTHGSGCTLSSAIAAELAKGKPMEEAVTTGHSYLQDAMTNPLQVSGKRFISHGVQGEF